MLTSQNEPRSLSSDAHKRIVTIHGAASAAVGAVSRLSSILPLANNVSAQELEVASEKLAGSLKRLDDAVTRMMQANVEMAGKVMLRAEQQETSDKWQKRYHAVERERDSLQEMLVALKERYERLQNAYNDRQQAYDLKVLEFEALQLRHLEGRQRLDQSLALLDAMLSATPEEPS